MKVLNFVDVSKIKRFYNTTNLNEIYTKFMLF